MRELVLFVLLAFLLVLSTQVIEFSGEGSLDLGRLGVSLPHDIPVEWHVALRFDRIWEFLLGGTPSS